ncbi:hypothetical protein LTR56_000748 [Elasticomyces elasticus]|nr:hypothetical protein LTR22_009096 [Elasticomyces elasticus]KAK3660372.1 hypothetical protein LTR56_000748 [Elasticomyces elasticus]KAK4929237.1 hypothetical protein LTR49_004134 [Elasticomyces elasticus]KAK5765793.1 hypothetical protein LTS12_004053 [Elasticomyces elasticus]
MKRLTTEEVALAQHPKGLVELDGRELEGGGQLVRIAVCLSALAGQPLRITRIRGRRPGGGGLKAQHLACVEWLAKACNATTHGAEKGSKTLFFEPGTGTYGDREGGMGDVFEKVSKEGKEVWEAKIDIGTVGATGLALQAVLPFVLFQRRYLKQTLPVHLTISGGTNVSGSPSFEYIDQVLVPMLGRIGFKGMTAKLGKRGWSQGSPGLGSFTLEIPASTKNLPLPAFQLSKYPQPDNGSTTRTRVVKVTATVIAPLAFHDHFRDRLEVFKRTGRKLANTPLEIKCEDSGHPKRWYLLVVAEINSAISLVDPQMGLMKPNAKKDTHKPCFLGRDWLYDRKLPNDVPGLAKVVDFICGRVMLNILDDVESEGTVDELMRDQLVVFQALSAGSSAVWPGWQYSDDEIDPGFCPAWVRKASMHAKTAEWVCGKMLGVKFEGQDMNHEVACDGIGYGGEEDGIKARRAEREVERLAERLKAERLEAEDSWQDV